MERKDRDWCALDSAARTIQANWRGAVTRQIVSLFLNARMIQSIWRRHAARKCLRRYLMARKIQNCYRCISAERIPCQHLAALDIQTACRCSVQCKKYGRFFCSRMIQSWWRGHSVRALYIKYMTCRKIQNPNGMEIQGFVQQVQTILCCPIYSGIVATRGPTMCIYRLLCRSMITSAVEGYSTAEII
jgi:hypothetical protein